MLTPVACSPTERTSLPCTGERPYVDKIARGTKITGLPIEQPTKFEFILNLKTAKAIGVELPTATLLRADEVME
jgi:hypothetical protein